MILRHADLPVTRWRNGGGRKADIASGPGWQLSFAWLEADGEFSDYSGQDRTITLLEGAGCVLEFEGRPPLVLDRVAAPAWFDGGWRTRGRLLGGPCLLLNAISDRARWRQNVEVRAPRPEDQGFAVLLSEGVTLPDGSIAGRWDTLPLPAALPPGAEAVVASFTPKA